MSWGQCAAISVKAATLKAAGAITGSGVITSDTRSPASAFTAAAVRASAR
jgi:hypothetical protein